jgi:glycosyltransferase involved in cell wall biosynthesis
MSRQNPLVSVIIPTFNRPQFLTQAINSVLAQSYTNLEVIIADDGSTDDTPDVIVGYGDRVRPLYLPHSGKPSVGRNAAVQAARGELIAFLDDDDLWLPDKVGRDVDKFGANPKVGLRYGQFRLLFSDGAQSEPIIPPRHRLSGSIFSELISDCFMSSSAVTVRAGLIERCGGFNEAFEIIDEYDVWLKISQEQTADFEPDPLVLIRRHDREIHVSRRLAVHINSVRMFADLKVRGRLTWSQRLRIQYAIARRSAHAGMMLRDLGEHQRARSYFKQSAAAYPFQKHAWMELAGFPRRERDG